VGEKVAQGSARPGPWSFEVLQNPAPRSGFAPGGRVLLTTGLVAATRNEAQLAAVLAHEVAHLELHLPAMLSTTNAAICKSQHSMTAVAKSGQAGLPKELIHADEAMVGAMEQMSFQLRLDLGPTAEEELAADLAALPLLARAGYAPAELRKVLQAAPVEWMFAPPPPTAADRANALGKVNTGQAGRAPPFPRKLQWPRP
jgi:predicted Zn-dependent protease